MHFFRSNSWQWLLLCRGIKYIGTRQILTARWQRSETHVSGAGFDRRVHERQTRSPSSPRTAWKAQCPVRSSGGQRFQYEDVCRVQRLQSLPRVLGIIQVTWHHWVKHGVPTEVDLLSSLHANLSTDERRSKSFSPNQQIRKVVDSQLHVSENSSCILYCLKYRHMQKKQRIHAKCCEQWSRVAGY